MSSSSDKITSLGAVGRRLLTQAQSATVWGATSHGIFLHLSSGGVIFLSFDPFKGPLTLNLTLSPTLFRDVKPGLPVGIESNRLIFDVLGLEIDTNLAENWSAPARIAPTPMVLAGGLDRLKVINQKVRAARPKVSSSDPIPASVVADGPDFLKIGSRLEKYLGLGEGLTPAGDDLVLGCLLALNRWGDLLYPDLDVREINRSLRQAARLKTNTLSANLIECASHGQADERLLLALDGILTGEPGPAACVAALLSWGHSSGASALTGMTATIAPAIIPKTNTK
jgi:hypothetical protein